MIFQIDTNARLIVSKEAIERLTEMRQSDSTDNEAGGILLGRHLIDSEDVTIDEISTPLNSDKRTRFSFFRSSGHNQIANKTWQTSNGYVSYIGGWHSHPENIPNPSSTDLKDWRKCSKNDSFHGTKLFFLIVGISKIICWSSDKNGEIKQLEEINEQSST
jgi:integrative and conjugative element protein (TIGR02256 family)